ncbi:MAG: class I SAM-dependent methyltransferase [Candidatus Micrarchaeota archaeon]|nr:class I SAM-dependent methyltransferase [Candidatus Micrarchaeota archaeon]
MPTNRRLAERGCAELQFEALAHKYEEFDGSLLKKFVTTEMVVTMAGNLVGKSVIDVGCGNGHFCRIYAAMGARDVLGIDSSATQIGKALSKSSAGIRYIQGNATCMAEVGGGFDVATAVFFFMYLDRAGLDEAARQIHMRLSSQGKLIAVITNPEILLPNGRKYGREIISLRGSANLDDGEKFLSAFYDSTGIHRLDLKAINYSKDTYERSLLRAGFSSIEWIGPKISVEGIKSCAEGFWDSYMRNPYSIGLIARKE